MNPLWQFSLDYYHRPGVEAECLSWQERFGADVNVLLMCLWCATLGRGLDSEILRGLLAEPSLDRWRRDVVGAIRAARHCSRTLALSADDEAPGALSCEFFSDALYRSLLDVELQAERIEQEMLWRWVRNLPPVSPDLNRQTLRQLAFRNVQAYGECLAVMAQDVVTVSLLVDALDAGD